MAQNFMAIVLFVFAFLLMALLPCSAWAQDFPNVKFHAPLMVPPPPLAPLPAEPHPSFDCSKAKDFMEKLVCSDVELADQDKQLAEQWQKMLSSYKGKQRQSLMKGQRIWLHLRTDACLERSTETSNNEQIECMSSVYKQRINMLKKQLTIHKKAPYTDFDKTLDSAVEELGRIYEAKHSGPDYNTYRDPRTCRELYALLSGGWIYSPDTIGADEETFSKSTCAFMILSGLNKPDYRLSPSQERIMKDQLAKRVAFINDEAEFHDVREVKFGDFTHQNRNEVLAIVYSHSTGTMKFSGLYFGYYDKLRESPNIQRIGAESPFPIPLD